MAATKKRQPQTTSRDPVTRYARSVLAGKTVAGPYVRAACERHMADLVSGPARGLTFDRTRVARAIGFFKDVLRLAGGEFEGRVYDPLPWQAFIIGSLFGWVNADGFRRFRVAYVETGKGSGKSPLAAGIGMYGLVADAEPRAEIYAAATKKDQAMILFRDAVAMVDQSPELSRRLHKSGGGGKEWNIAALDSGSFFRPISADDGNSGPRPHIALLDEIHEHRTGYVVEMLKAGQKGRRQPLMFMITNSGATKLSVCWEYHDYGAKVAAQQIADDSFFAYVCALDDADDPFRDTSCWQKANPSLGVTIPRRYLEEQITQSRGMPSKESIVRRLNFCQWTGAESPWISLEVWKKAYRPYDIEDLRGRRAVAGLDLSSTTDLTALVFFVEPLEDGEPWKIVPFAWLPDDDLQRKGETDRVPYVQWHAAGHLNTTPGRAISKRVVLQKLSAMCDFFEVTACAYDRWRMEDLIAMAEDDGISLPEMKPFGQGYQSMSPALENFERMLLNGEIAHNNHPVLNMCANNAVTDSDAAGNRKLDKSRATGRIDLIVAVVMAAGVVNAIDAGGKSFWETLHVDTRPTPALAA